MKKKIVLLTMLLLFCFAGTAYATDVTVKIDGKVLTQKSLIIDGEVMIPIIEVAHELGFEASYDLFSIDGIEDLTEEVRLKANENNEIAILGIDDKRRKKPHQNVASMSGDTYSRLLPGADGSRTSHFKDYTSKVAMQVHDGVVLVPLNAAITMLDTQAKWEPDKNTVTFFAGVQPPSIYSNLVEVTIKVDGVVLSQKGVILEGRTMVPIRDIGETLGITVEYEDNVISLRKGEIPFGMIVGEHYSVVTLQPTGNGYYEAVSDYRDSDVPMQNINGKMMVPLKVISEMLNADINWDATNRVASITQKPESQVSDNGLETDLTSGDTKILVDGKELSQKGVIIDKQIMVPIDEIVKSLGLEVKYYDSGKIGIDIGYYKSVVIDGNTCEITSFGSTTKPIGNSFNVPGTKDYYTTTWEQEDEIFKYDVSAQWINGKMMVPAKMIDDIFYTVSSFDEINFMLNIKSREYKTEDIANNKTVD